MSTEKNNIIQSCIDVDLMDIKNISNIIEDYTVEYHDEQPNAFYFYRDFMRIGYTEAMNNIPSDGLKGLYLNKSYLRVVGDKDTCDLLKDLRYIEQILIQNNSRFRRM